MGKSGANRRNSPLRPSRLIRVPRSVLRRQKTFDGGSIAEKVLFGEIDPETHLGIIGISKGLAGNDDRVEGQTFQLSALSGYAVDRGDTGRPVRFFEVHTVKQGLYMGCMGENKTGCDNKK